MSAIVTILHPNAVHFVTDTALYDSAGAYRGERSKVAIFSHMGAAFAVSGCALAMPIIMNQLWNLECYADLRAKLSGSLLQISQTIPLVTHDPDDARFRLWAAGWLEGRPTAFITSTFPGDSSAFELQPIAGISISPNSDLIETAVINLAAGRSSHDLDPARDGLAILEIQRRHKVKIKNTGKLAHVVGGAAHLTSVFQDRIETRLLHRWRDTIGQPIAPHDNEVARHFATV